MASLCLMSQDNQIVCGYDPQYMTSYIKDNEITNHDSLVTASKNILTKPTTINGFSLVTILSDDTILSQTSVAFRNAYAFLLVVSLVGMVLIFLGCVSPTGPFIS